MLFNARCNRKDVQHFKTLAFVSQAIKYFTKGFDQFGMFFDKYESVPLVSVDVQFGSLKCIVFFLMVD